MNSDDIAFVKPIELRVGHYVDLEVSWLTHPFPSGSFRIRNLAQIETIRGLGLEQVRIIPSKSDPQHNDSDSIAPQSPINVPRVRTVESPHVVQQALPSQPSRDEQLRAQRNSLALCERRLSEAMRQVRLTMETAHRQPKEAGEQCLALVMGMVSDMLINGESAIRLLNGASGDRLSTHTVNVTVVSILLGKAMGLSQQQLVDLGMAAFLHDIGKTVLPDRMRWMEDSFTSAEIRLYQEHVAKGVVLCKPMELPPEVIAAIAQHHELADGSGFPLKVKAGNITPAARILALVNRYDNLCNPSKPSMALTPHEALAKIYAQSKSQFDTLSLSAFIRMMGIYPPGSVVQLNDDRHALVVSVNTARPLKPSVIVHEPGVERHEALVVNLESNSNLGIRKSLRPSQLPSAAIDSLDPGQRVSYYFEPSAFGELQ